MGCFGGPPKEKIIYHVDVENMPKSQLYIKGKFKQIVFEAPQLFFFNDSQNTEKWLLDNYFVAY